VARQGTLTYRDKTGIPDLLHVSVANLISRSLQLSNQLKGG
jgi:hypothetical protein